MRMDENPLQALSKGTVSSRLRTVKGDFAKVTEAENGLLEGRFAGRMGVTSTLKPPFAAGVLMSEVNQALGAATRPAASVWHYRATVREAAVQVRLRLAPQDGVLDPSFALAMLTSPAWRGTGATLRAAREAKQTPPGAVRWQPKRTKANWRRSGLSPSNGVRRTGVQQSCSASGARSSRSPHRRTAGAAHDGRRLHAHARWHAQGGDSSHRSQSARLLESDDSWFNRLLFTMESNGDEDAKGFNYLARIETATTASHLHLRDIVKGQWRDSPPSRLASAA